MLGRTDKMYYKTTNATARVMLAAPIRTDVGRLRLRQCKPKLRFVPAVSLNRRKQLDKIANSDTKIQSLRENLRLISITRGKNI